MSCDETPDGHWLGGHVVSVLLEMDIQRTSRPKGNPRGIEKTHSAYQPGESFVGSSQDQGRVGESRIREA